MVEIIDLVALKTVAMVDVAQQAAGIDFWKPETVKGVVKAEPHK